MLRKLNGRRIGMGVFRGEFFFFFRTLDQVCSGWSGEQYTTYLIIRLFKKGLPSHNKRTHAFADDNLHAEKTGPPAPSIPNAAQPGSPKFTNITTPPPNPSSRTTKTLNGSRVKSPTGCSYPITRFWGLWRRKLWCWRGLRCRICRARLGGI